MPIQNELLFILIMFLILYVDLSFINAIVYSKYCNYQIGRFYFFCNALIVISHTKYLQQNFALRANEGCKKDYNLKYHHSCFHSFYDWIPKLRATFSMFGIHQRLRYGWSLVYIYWIDNHPNRNLNILKDLFTA